MTWRTVVVSSRSKVSYSMGYMVIRGEELRRVFLDEVHTVMVESTAVAMTASWIDECMKRKIRIILCDPKRNPEGEFMPYHGSFDSSRRIREQIQWTKESKDLIWQAIMKEKINKQAKLLRFFEKEKEAALLESYISQVEPGDVTNREGFAAKVYFNGLFGMDFTRREDNVKNGALNYGYAILLSACNREAAACGYLAQIGVFHDNLYNPFNLGSDLMEPFRPLIDREVLLMNPTKMEKEEKMRLVNVMNQKVFINGRETSVNQAIGIYERSVFKAIEEGKPELIRFYSIDYGK